MLKIIVGAEEFYDTETEEFISKNGVELELEHSLVSLSKWESIFEKPFLSSEEKTTDEVLAYIRYMNTSREIAPEVFKNLSEQNVKDVNAYLESKQTATWFNDKAPTARNQEVVTAELIYYWMISFNIPMECQYWHLNRLFTLIKVFNVKNAKPKKMSRARVAERNRTLNEQRKKQFGTSG